MPVFGPVERPGPDAGSDLQYLEVELARPWEGGGNLQQGAGLGMTRWGFAGPGQGGGSAGPGRRGGWEGIYWGRWEAMEVEDPELGGDGGGLIWKTTW